PARASAPSPPGGRGWRPRGPRPRSAHAPRRSTPRRAPAAASLGRCPLRSRRRRTRCPAPAVRSPLHCAGRVEPVGDDRRSAALGAPRGAGDLLLLVEAACLLGGRRGAAVAGRGPPLTLG